MSRLLRIRSERAPYRRAGLSFGDERFIEIELEELSVEQIRTLALDESLRIEAFVGGKFRPVSFDRENMELDGLIAALKAAFDGENDAPVDVADAQHADATLVHSLRDELADARDQIDVLATARNGLTEELANASSKLGEATTRVSELEEQLRNEAEALKTALARAEEAEAKFAALSTADGTGSGEGGGQEGAADGTGSSEGGSQEDAANEDAPPTDTQTKGASRSKRG